MRFQPSVAFSRRCGQAGLGVTIIGIPGMWTDGSGSYYGNYPVRYDAYGRAYGY